MKYLIKIAYDGTNYCGWQKNEGVESIQGKVEEALSKLLKKNTQIRGASRTDAGVHAKGQIAVFEAETSIPADRFPYALNPLLPDDIRIVGGERVDDEFHPQKRVEKKTYEYLIYNSEFPDPRMRNFTSFERKGERKKLDIKKMEKAAEKFIGTHDFKAFCASGGNTKTTIRTIYDLTVCENNNIISIRVTGSGFLYNMVRIIAGTLIAVGEGRIKSDELEEIIRSKQRERAGKTADACGLTLLEIYYRNEYLKEKENE
ncbi:MAG: tRNA pseudouridine(38-40) synthase TruA [Firmicutes bacterium]|nr:tRNA pseudouridine(38-40) synthase TruA [Bacillota bacterium]